MKLRDALQNLNGEEPDATIWIESGRVWSPDSRVLIASEHAEGGSPDPAFEYFLEVAVILDTFGQVWPDLQSFAERVIHYAKFDA